jgi:hypothetical protein
MEMSYNIDNILQTTCSLSMSLEDFSTFAESEDLPELNFFKYEICYELSEEAAIIKQLWWSGQWSGHGWDFLVDEILPATKGAFNGIVVWEGGDSIKRLIVNDGAIEYTDVV